MSSARGQLTIPDVIASLTKYRDMVPIDIQSVILQINAILDMLQHHTIVWVPTQITFLWTAVHKMDPYVYHIGSDRVGISAKLLEVCTAVINIINWARTPVAPVVARRPASPVARIPVAPVVPRQSASPVVPRQSAPPETYTHDDAVRCLNDANTAGDNDVYSNMLPLLARLRGQEKSTVFADIISAICTAAQDGYLYASCASLCDHYNTGQNCRECGITRLPNTDHHESWNDRLCPNGAAARHSGAAPIPVDRSPVAGRLVSDYTGCPMCATGKHDGRHRICRKMPPICDGCLATAQLLAKELCPKPGSVFCIACHENHPYQPTR